MCKTMQIESAIRKTVLDVVALSDKHLTSSSSAVAVATIAAQWMLVSTNVIYRRLLRTNFCAGGVAEN